MCVLRELRADCALEDAFQGPWPSNKHLVKTDQSARIHRLICVLPCCRFYCPSVHLMLSRFRVAMDLLSIKRNVVPGGQGGEDGDFVQLRVVREKVGPFIYDNLI